MSYYSELPIELIDSINNNKCLLFIGSGISRKCITKGRKTLPDWKNLLKRFIYWKQKKKRFEEIYYSELKRLLDEEKYLILAEELLESVDEAELKEYLETVFDTKNIIPSFLHNLISLIPFRGIITTNYDNLIELAYINSHSKLPKIFLNSDINTGINPSDYEYFILKMHGDIDSPHSIVLSQKNYNQYMYNSDIYSKILEKLFSEHNVLFIGYGGKDPNIETLINKVSMLKQNKTFFKLNMEGSLTSIEIKRSMKDRNMKIIEYVDYFGFHNHIDTFFTDLITNLSNTNFSNKLPNKLRTNINIFYNEKDIDDGEFLWHYFFRNGAITLCTEAQRNQKEYFLEGIKKINFLTNFLVFYIGVTINSDFLRGVKKICRTRKKNNFQIIIVSLNKNKGFINQNFNQVPKFFVREKFSDFDLEQVKQYISNLM